MVPMIKMKQSDYQSKKVRQFIYKKAADLDKKVQ